MANNLYKKIADDTRKRLVDSYEKSGRKASGTWEKELESLYEDLGDTVVFKVIGMRYTGALLSPGRRANKKKSRGEVLKLYPIAKQWAEDKGININPFAVAYKWVYKGISVPNAYNDGQFIDNVINASWVDETARKVGFGIVEDFKSDILERLRKL